MEVQTSPHLLQGSSNRQPKIASLTSKGRTHLRQKKCGLWNSSPPLQQQASALIPLEKSAIDLRSMPLLV